MVSIACIFCHQDNAPVVIQENNYNGKKCNSCNLIYISPRPRLETIGNLYSHDQAHLSAQDHIASEYSKKLHALHSLAIIKKYVSSGDLLEIGSGAGYFLIQAKLQGFNPYGIELNPIQASFIQKTLKIPCLKDSLSLDSFGNKTFDIIYHSDVVSHFYDPIEAFNIMHNKLKPGGYLIFETGNIADLDSAYYHAFNAMQYPDHLFFFGKQSIKTLLITTNFNLKKYYSYAILPQLKIIKAITRLKAVISRKSPSPLLHALPTNTIRKTSFFRNCYHFFMHTVRYTAGAILPTTQKPQTMIIVAQKKTLT